MYIHKIMLMITWDAPKRQTTLAYQMPSGGGHIIEPLHGIETSGSRQQYREVELFS